MKNRKTISHIINRSFLTVCLVFSAMCVVLCMVELSRYRNSVVQQVGASLIKNTVGYYPKIITSLLNSDGTIGSVLDQVRDFENLYSADIVPDLPLSAYACIESGLFAPTTDPSICIYESGNSVVVYQRLISGGAQLGFLRKEKRVPIAYVDVLSHLCLPVIMWFLGMLLLVFLVKKQLNKSVSRPLHLICKDPGNAFRSQDADQVDEISQLAHAIHRANTQVEESVKREAASAKRHSLEKAASQVAHDIRSPLSSMQTALMLLREQCAGKNEVAEPLNLLQLSSSRLNDIANGLLAKYKGEESAQQIFSIHEVLDELIGELRASPLGAGVEFRKKYSASALYITGDKSTVSRAIGNVVKNALEAMQQNASDKAKQLTVSTILGATSPQPAPTGGERISIRITDTGPGIPADKIPLILQGGYSVGKSDGHGIGTKVLRDMVDAHKGTLAIESEVGVGTTFIVSLPATIQNEDTVISIPVTVIASPAGARQSRIIVIDDETSLREQWRLTLKAQGVVPEIYSCWEEFISSRHLISELHCEDDDATYTFIVDYHFDNSEVDGLEIIRRLKEKGASRFILATAEYWKPEIKEAAQKLNATLCPKPLPKVVVEQSPRPVGEGFPQTGQEGEGVFTETGPSVLLIDDDKGIQVSWKMMKQRWGVADLKIFSRLEDMIAAAVDPAEFDLCVIDKNVPDSQYDGGEMLAYLKQKGAKKVVLATGEQETDIRRDAIYQAIDGILAEKIPTSLNEYLN